MNLTELSNILTKAYNTIGNSYITKNFISEPFVFKVEVRYGDLYEYHEYYADISSVPDMPEFFRYRPEVRKKLNKVNVGVDREIIGFEFKEMISYIDSERAKLIGVNFINK